MSIDPTTLDNLRIEPGVVTGTVKENHPIHGKDKLVLEVQGVTRFIDFVAENFDKPKMDKHSSRLGKTITGGGWTAKTVEFHDYETYEETLDVFRNSPGTLVKFDPTEVRPTQYEESGRDVDYGVTGDFIDVGRFLEGVPESMGSMHNGRSKNRRVRIMVSNNHSWSTDKNDVIHRSERIIRLVDALEQGQTRTEIMIIDANECSHIEVLVKRFDESLVLEDVAIATHVDFLRRLGFRVREYSATWRDGYGTSDWINSRRKNFMSDLNDEITVFVDGDMEDKNRIDERFDKLENMLEEELSNSQAENNLFIVSDTGVKASYS